MGWIGKAKASFRIWWPVSRVTDFRVHQDNVAWAKRFLYSSKGREMQSFLLDGMLATRFYPGDRLTQEQAALEYARILGYIEAFHRLQSCAVDIPKIQPPLEADYDQTKPADATEEEEEPL